MTDPIALWVGLALGLGLMLALGAVLYLAIVLPRRVMRLVLEERAATDDARTEKAALRAATAVEVAGIVCELRAYHEEIADRARTAREITTAAAAEEVAHLVRYLRALVAWLQAVADARYAQARAAMDAGVADDDVPPPDREAATQRPGQTPTSPAPPPPQAPGSAPPVSVSALSSDPAQRAAGLGRPKAAPLTKSGPPRPPPRPSGAPSPTSSRAGLGSPPADLGDSGAWVGLGAALKDVEARLEVPRDVEDRLVSTVLEGREAARARGDAESPPPSRRSVGSAPTLVSLVPVAKPSPRPVPRVEVEDGSRGVVNGGGS